MYTGFCKDAECFLPCFLCSSFVGEWTSTQVNSSGEEEEQHEIKKFFYKQQRNWMCVCVFRD